MRSMTTQDADRAARNNQFFARHFLGDHQLRDLNALRGLLPDDPLDLRTLQARCMDAARKAQHSGQHMEMLRLEHLSRQLAQLAGR